MDTTQEEWLAQYFSAKEVERKLRTAERKKLKLTEQIDRLQMLLAAVQTREARQ